MSGFGSPAADAVAHVDQRFSSGHEVQSLLEFDALQLQCTDRSCDKSLTHHSACRDEESVLKLCDSSCAETRCCTEVSSPATEEKVFKSAEEECWGQGQVRVLAVFGAGENDEAGCASGPADRVEEWCKLCNIADVQVLQIASASDHTLARILTHALTALAARCDQGDICVLILVGLPDMVRSASDEANPSLYSSVICSILPSYLTFVCVSDSANTVEHVGL